MTDDIVARLRDFNPWRDPDWPEVVRSAADEIERLRAVIEALEWEIRETAEACHD